jgi:hypothetical protein
MRARGALWAMRTDPRPPVLLLRAFGDDGLRVGSRQVWWAAGAPRPFTFEQLLQSMFARCGPVIAIGRPGEALPHLGAARFWIGDAHWQEAVDELLGECQFVVMIMGRLDGRAGLRWEAERLFGLAAAAKVVHVMPPLAARERVQRWEQYRRLSGGRLPPGQGTELAATFDEAGRCVVARLPCRDQGHPPDAIGEGDYRAWIHIQS